MKLAFFKYHGTGNDFILIDNREGKIRLSTEEVAQLCDRHFGIGADGLMFLTTAPGYDFGMTYYNSNGKESTMCGNGGRCITAFAKSLGLIEKQATFKAIDGEHKAEVLTEEGAVSKLRLKMSHVPNHEVQVSEIKSGNSSFDIRHSSFLINTGSPHLVIFTDNVKGIDVVSEGRKLRNDPQFAPEGINIDFVEITDNGLFVRTYERGVEDETLSCGTGVTAAAIAVGSGQWAVGSGQSAIGSPQLSDSTGIIARNEVTKQTRSETRIEIETLGGHLTVSFRQEGDSFTDIWLEGPAEFVFPGEVWMKSET